MCVLFVFAFVYVTSSFVFCRWGDSSNTVFTRIKAVFDLKLRLKLRLKTYLTEKYNKSPAIGVSSSVATVCSAKSFFVKDTFISSVTCTPNLP